MYGSFPRRPALVLPIAAAVGALPALAAWKPLDSRFIEKVHSLAVRSDTAWAGTDNGVRRSVDGGGT